MTSQKIIDLEIKNYENITSNMLEFIKSRGWYKDNVSVSECISRNSKGWESLSKLIEKEQEIVRIKKKIIEIAESINDTNTCNQYLSEVIENEKRIIVFKSLPDTFRDDVNKVLKSFNPESRIQENL